MKTVRPFSLSCGVPILFIPPIVPETTDPPIDEVLTAIREASTALHDADALEVCKSADVLARYMRAGRMSRAVSVAWNICQLFAFAYGIASRTNGVAEEKQTKREESATHGSTAWGGKKKKCQGAARATAAARLRKEGTGAWPAIVGDLAKTYGTGHDTMAKHWLKGLSPNKAKRAKR